MSDRPFIVRALVDELPLKVLSLILAISLCVVVRSDKEATTGAYVKVIYTLPSDRVLVSDPVGEVKVGIRGTWTRLQRLDERDIDPIHVDLSRLHGSVLHFDEDQVRLPVGLRVTSITPSDIKLDFEPRVTRSVRVQPLLEGEPADGFRVIDVTAQPVKVQVDGAKSVVDGMARVPTRPFRIAGARGPIRGEVALEAPPHHARFLDPTQVTIEVNVRAAMIERMVEAPVVVTGLDRMTATTDPPQVKVILRGPSDLVRGIPASAIGAKVEAQMADQRPPSHFIRTVTVAGLPAGVAAEVRPASVTVRTRRRHE